MQGVNLINVTESSFFNTRMFNNLTKNTTISTANNQHLFRIRMRIHSEMSNHFLIPKINLHTSVALRKFITFSSLNDAIENKNIAVIGTFKHKNILIFRFLY